MINLEVRDILIFLWRKDLRISAVHDTFARYKGFQKKISLMFKN